MKIFDKLSFSNDIRQRRLIENRLTLRDLALIVNISFTVLSKYESMEVMPNALNLLVMCNWMNQEPLKYLKNED